MHWDCVRERERCVLCAAGMCVCVCVTGENNNKNNNISYLFCAFCVGVRKFLIAALTGSGQMAFGLSRSSHCCCSSSSPLSLSPALLRLCKCQQSACCCPATALCTHKKYVFFTLPFIFAHRLRWKARERERERGRGKHCKMSLS